MVNKGEQLNEESIQDCQEPAQDYPVPNKDIAEDAANGIVPPAPNEGVGLHNARGTRSATGTPTPFQTQSGCMVKITSKMIDASENFGSINLEYSTKLAVTPFYNNDNYVG
jgi:hypothetical protein